ncbi:MAG: lytic transglycosylase domain-containing protein [Filifactor alocis]|uniref:lytic transglycosylase domain-containing protein n=1 Tax=Filifactor alocis TaxID=143361 RepID=UPI003F9FC320
MNIKRCIGVVSALFLLCFTTVSAEVETPVIIPAEIYEAAVFASDKFDVPVENIVAMILVENRSFDTELRSSTKDSGMCQINDGILKDFYNCGFRNVYDVQENVEFGTMRLKWAYDKYQDWHKAYMVYNMGDGRAKRLFRKGLTQSRYSRKCMEYLKIKDKWKIRAEDGRLYTLLDYDVIMWD